MPGCTLDCGDNGVCLSLGTFQFCDCNNGYTGDYCDEFDSDYVSSSSSEGCGFSGPCLHGTCVTRFTEAGLTVSYCDCQIGYIGDQCDIE